MGLTLGEYKCLNCNDYEFDDDDLIEEKIKDTDKRGSFKINVRCPNCKAAMSMVYFMMHNDFAVAFMHTENDEPCYDRECWKCYGNISQSKWVGNK